ncbi:MurR/RpiR family transcriptional regulator [Lachnospiraceae bacterium 54-53]
MIIEQLSNDKKLTSSEKQIAKTILEYPRFVINLSLAELSRQCYVSQASIIRFCKKLGAKGFADFKVQLATELSSFALKDQEIPVDIPIPPNADFNTVAQIMYNLSQQSLEAAFQTLDHNAVKRAANQLSKAGLIHIYGRGESLILAEDFHYKLLRLGIHSSLESLNGFQEASSIRASGNIHEIALVISQYCNSQQVKYIIDELVSAHIPFILLTAAENPWPYNRYAAETLHFSSEESRHKMGSFSSRTAALYVLDCLFGYMFALNYEENKNNLARFSQRKMEREYFYKPGKD